MFDIAENQGRNPQEMNSLLLQKTIVKNKSEKCSYKNKFTQKFSIEKPFIDSAIKYF